MFDTIPVYESNKEWPDYLLCKFCGERVERGIFNVSHHWVHCEKNTKGLIKATTDFERKILDSWSINT